MITPPNFGAGAGIWFPWIVVVALGEPSTPVTCWAITGMATMRVMTLGVSASRSNQLFTPQDFDIDERVSEGGAAVELRLMT